MEGFTFDETREHDGWEAWREAAARETAALAEANAAEHPGDVDGQQWLLTLNDKRPPLSKNYRLHYREAAKRAKVVRHAASFLARSARIPKLERCSVQFIWVVARADRKRDADNIVDTLKPFCDGLVDAGVVPDDTPDFMAKPECLIEVRRGATPHLEFIVTRLEPLERADGTPLAAVEAVIAPRRNGKATRREATPGNLIDFERENPGKPDGFRKYPLIRELFGMTPVTYTAALISAAGTREALERDAITANRILEQVDAGRADRARRVLGRES